MKFYEIGWGGYEESRHITFFGEAEVTEEQLRECVIESFDKWSVDNVRSNAEEMVKWQSVPHLSDMLTKIAEDVASKFGLQIVDKQVTAKVYGWEYEFSKKAADQLVGQCPEILKSTWHTSFQRDYATLEKGKTPDRWMIVRGYYGQD